MSRFELARLPSVLLRIVASGSLSLSLLVFNEELRLGFEPEPASFVLEMSKVELARWPSVRRVELPSLTFELSRLVFKTSFAEMSESVLLMSNILAWSGIFGNIRTFRFGHFSGSLLTFVELSSHFPDVVKLLLSFEASPAELTPAELSPIELSATEWSLLSIETS